jgi:hypothetical protein
MALGSQVVAYRLPTKRLWGGFEMALGSFARPHCEVVRRDFRGNPADPPKKVATLLLLSAIT